MTLCSTVLKPTSLFADGIAWALVLLLLADKYFIANSDLMTKPRLAPSLTNLLTEQPTMMEELSNSCLYKAVCVAQGTEHSLSRRLPWRRCSELYGFLDLLGDHLVHIHLVQPAACLSQPCPAHPALTEGSLTRSRARHSTKLRNLFVTGEVSLDGRVDIAGWEVRVSVKHKYLPPLFPICRICDTGFINMIR